MDTQHSWTHIHTGVGWGVGITYLGQQDGSVGMGPAAKAGTHMMEEVPANLEKFQDSQDVYVCV